MIKLILPVVNILAFAPAVNAPVELLSVRSPDPLLIVVFAVSVIPRPLKLMTLLPVAVMLPSDNLNKLGVEPAIVLMVTLLAPTLTGPLIVNAALLFKVKAPFAVIDPMILIALLRLFKLMPPEELIKRLLVLIAAVCVIGVPEPVAVKKIVLFKLLKIPLMPIVLPEKVKLLKPDIV